MNVFRRVYNSVVDAAHNRYDNKLKEGLIRLDIKLKQEPKFHTLASQYFSTRNFSNKLTEYLIWSIGDENIIRNYFRDHQDPYVVGEDTKTNQFWKVAPSEYPMVHTGFPSIMASKSAEILFGSGFDVDVNIYKKTTTPEGIETIGEDIDEKESARIKEMLTDVLFQDMSLYERLMGAGFDEAWSGHIAAKLSFDRSITPYPILEFADLRFFEVAKERGYTTAIVFKQWYSDETSRKKYRLDEIYTTVRKEEELSYFRINRETNELTENLKLEVGDAVIRYELYDVSNEKETLVDFSLCPALTAGVKPFVAFPGIKGMLAIEKPNRLINQQFKNLPYGSSDFAGLGGQFHSVDELYSENAREVRDNKTIQAIPEEWLPKDKDGNPLKRDSFRTNVMYSKANNDLDQTQGKKPDPLFDVAEIQDKTESILGKWKIEVNQICVKSGYSPTTFGIYGFESIAASSDAQQEREKATIETRKGKIKLWRPFLEKLFMKILQLNSWILENDKTIEQPGIPTMDVDFSNCTINVTFPDYVKATTTELINTWGSAKRDGLGDLESILKKVWSPLGLTDKEIKEMADKLRIENNMALDNPNALSMDNILNPNPDDDKNKGGK